MVLLGKENLLHEKSKIALSISGVVVSVFLIFATTGIYTGIISVVENMILKAGADVWVTAKGASGSLHSPSILPENLGAELETVAGIQEVAPLIRIPVSFEVAGEKVLLNVNGYDTSRGLGGPWKIHAGKSDPGQGEIVIDRVLARKSGLGVGDNLDLQGKIFTIVGISDETFTMISYMVFVPIDDARIFLPAGLTNFFLVRVAEGFNPADVARRIEETLPVSATTSQENANMAKDETVGGFLPIVLVISAVGVVVGILVVGLLVYTMTIEKSREYAVLRAVGAGNMYLYRIVLFQAMVVSVAGFLVGAAVTPPVVSLLRYMVPEFIVTVTPVMMLWVFLLFIATGVVASFVPVKRLAAIDPALVFK